MGGTQKRTTHNRRSCVQPLRFSDLPSKNRSSCGRRLQREEVRASASEEPYRSSRLGSDWEPANSVRKIVGCLERYPTNRLISCEVSIKISSSYDETHRHPRDDRR
jgi:hypothetical protein